MRTRPHRPSRSHLGDMRQILATHYAVHVTLCDCCNDHTVHLAFAGRGGSTMISLPVEAAMHLADQIVDKSIDRPNEPGDVASVQWYGVISD